MGLSNREIASLIWLAIFIVFAARYEPVRSAALVVLKVLFVGPLVRLLGGAFIYTALCVAALAYVGIWTPANLKTTLLWSVMFALMTIVDLKRISEERLFLRQMLRETLSIAVIFTFLIDTYPLSLVGELLLMPAATFLALLQASAESNPAHASVRNLAGWLLSAIGLSYLIYSANAAITHWNDFATVNNARELAVPLLLSLMSLPYLYFLRLFVGYENVFSVVQIPIPDDRLRRFAKRHALLNFRFSLDLLRRWRRAIMIERPDSKEGVRAITHEVRLVLDRERNPPNVAPSEGWSPYVAKTFLHARGIETDDYHRLFDDAWRSSSTPVKIGQGTLLPTLTYYVDGNELAARELTIELDVFGSAASEEADKWFWEIASLFVVKAIGADAAGLIANQIANDDEAEAIHAPWRIRAEKKVWTTGKLPNYERSLTVSIICAETAKAECIQFQ